MSTTLAPIDLIPADKKLITPEQLSAHATVAIQTLANWRLLGRGPKYVRVGRLIRYRMKDVEAWLAASAK